MSPFDRRLITRLAQSLSILFVTVYFYLTQPLYAINTVWFVLAIALFTVGLFRKFSEMLWLSVFVEIIYVLFMLYQYYFAFEITGFGWNSFAWLGIFPYMAIMGVLGQSSLLDASHAGSPFFAQLPEGQEQSGNDIHIVDESLQFASATAFLYKLEEEVIKCLRERRKFHLLVVEIAHFRDYKRIIGREQSGLLLNQFAGCLNDIAGQADAKAQLGEGTLAVLLDEAEGEDSVAAVKSRLNDHLYELLLTRPRRESSLKLRLKFGAAVCPHDGIEARALLDKAQSDLEWNGM